MNSITMNSLLVSLVLFAAVVALSSAQGGGPGGPGGRRPGGPGGRGPGGHRGHGPGGPGGKGMLKMFASCQTLDEALKKKHQEMWSAKQIGPEANNCEATDKKECMIKDMKTVRCAVPEQPSDECIQDVMSYLQASACEPDATEDNGP